MALAEPGRHGNAKQWQSHEVAGVDSLVLEQGLPIYA
jgi:hypothetical protein